MFSCKILHDPGLSVQVVYAIKHNFDDKKYFVELTMVMIYQQLRIYLLPHVFICLKIFLQMGERSFTQIWTNLE